MLFIVFIALAYLLALFFIAYLGDSKRFQFDSQLSNNVSYALSLAVYCSSWTFYGAVGTAVVDGLDYVAIYLGPCLVFLFGYPVMRRIIAICKQDSITSISDFIASRFGKSRRIGVLVTTIAVIGSLPYIALQLKAVSMSFLVLSEHAAPSDLISTTFTADNVAFYTGAILVLFSVLFGTRHLDATEHHAGMVLAISFESVAKLVAILAVGFYACYLLFDQSAQQNFQNFISGGAFQASVNSSTWLSFSTKLLLSMGAIVLLPRQFQMTVVEAHNPQQFKTAAWVMPVYLLLTTVIVVPIAITGTSLLPNGQADLYVLSLPLIAGNEFIGLIAFIGGLSAATGMVIVAVISLSTMICNDLVMPNLIRIKQLDIVSRPNLDAIILFIRRMAIVLLMAGAYGYYSLMDTNLQLANIGLVSFAAVIQFLPAVLCALFWQKAHSSGVFWGLVAGFVVWAYTLFLPSVLGAQQVASFWGDGALLHPNGLFGISMGNSLTHGVVWSLAVNLALVYVLSVISTQPMLEKIQASRFFHAGDDVVDQLTANDAEPILIHPESLRILAERIIGLRHTQSVFEQYHRQSGNNVGQMSHVDRLLVSLVQTAIASVIGSASAQKVTSDVMVGEGDYLGDATNMVDEASLVLQFNRHLLQTTLENITHGISVVDKHLNLVIWNQRYIELFDYPENFIYVGKPVREVLEYNAQRGDFKDPQDDQAVSKRLKHLQRRQPYQSVRTRANGRVIKTIGEPMPNGGFVSTYEDITESVRASELLRKANEELEDRVLERTKELELLTEKLEETTRSKTHFLAAASHDVLQPINAARLFTHSILERSEQHEDIAHLASNVDQSLITANELLRALLDISKLDAGGIKPEYSTFNLKPFLNALALEMGAVANAEDIELQLQVADLMVRSDQRLLHSVLQNLVTNAIRYTPAGGQVRIIAEIDSDRSDVVNLRVADTGIGISNKDIDKVFNEFYQVKSKQGNNKVGLGLGLSIVKRISGMLGLQVAVSSESGMGSEFSIELPLVTNAQPKPGVANEQLSTVPSQRLAGVPVLCVENDLSVLTAMQTILDGWGCEATVASDYDTACTLFDEMKFDLVLVDYQLDGEETGMDFLARVHAANADRPQSPVGGILITAEQDEALPTSATELGFKYLAKPLEPTALKSLMLSLLREAITTET